MQSAEAGGWVAGGPGGSAGSARGGGRGTAPVCPGRAGAVGRGACSPGSPKGNSGVGSGQGGGGYSGGGMVCGWVCVCGFIFPYLWFELPTDLSIITTIIKFLNVALTDCVFFPILYAATGTNVLMLKIKRRGVVAKPLCQQSPAAQHSRSPLHNTF